MVPGQRLRDAPGANGASARPNALPLPPDSAPAVVTPDAALRRAQRELERAGIRGGASL
jgi:hypothetical protein